MKREDKKQSNTKKRRFPNGLYFVVVVFFVVVASIRSYNIFLRTANTQDEIYAIMKEIEQEKRINLELKEEIANINSDSFIETQARDKLGLVKPSEIIYKNIDN